MNSHLASPTKVVERFPPVFFDPELPALKDVLLERYLKPAARWLLGSTDSPYLLPQAANSSWECALAIWYLLDLRTTLSEDDPLSEEIRSKTAQTARWILDRAESSADGSMHWEGVTWDTAVCVRSGLRVLRELPDSFSDAEQQRGKEICASALEWLLARFEVWDRAIIYPYGPADVAQILETLLYVQREWPQLLDVKSGPLAKIPEAIDEIAAYLLAAKEEMATGQNQAQGPEALAFWSDFFQSGEVIDCLSQYARYVDTPDRRASCEEHVFHCIRYFELNQVNGQWGAHVDTCRALYGYLRATHVIPVARQENHIVLKALRWMCDDKQTFSDGSFLHSPFVTVFFAAALWEAYAHWPLAKRSVGEVYDVALWSAPVRATEERGLRLALEIEREQLLAAQDETIRRFKDLRRHFVGALVAVIVAIVGTALSIVLGVLEMSVTANEPEVTFSYFAIVVAVLGALAGYAVRSSNG
jgi:hypothetical protein